MSKELTTVPRDEQSQSQQQQQQQQLILPPRVARTVSALARVSHSSLSLVDLLNSVWFKSVAGGTRLAFDTLLLFIKILNLPKRLLFVNSANEQQAGLVDQSKSAVLGIIGWWQYVARNSIKAADDVLLLVDSMFGHTDTSRALSSFMRLVDYELKTPTDADHLLLGCEQLAHGNSDPGDRPTSSLTLTTLTRKQYTNGELQVGHTIYSVGVVNCCRAFISYLTWIHDSYQQVQHDAQLDVIYEAQVPAGFDHSDVVVVGGDVDMSASTYSQSTARRSRVSVGEEIELLLNGVDDVLTDDDEDDVPQAKSSRMTDEDSGHSSGDARFHTYHAGAQLPPLPLNKPQYSKDDTFEIRWDRSSVHSLASSYATLPVNLYASKRSSRSKLRQPLFPGTPLEVNGGFGFSSSSALRDNSDSDYFTGGASNDRQPPASCVSVDHDFLQQLANETHQDQESLHPYHESSVKLLDNLSHYSRYATAAYGTRFMKLMGIASYPHYSTYKSTASDETVTLLSDSTSSIMAEVQAEPTALRNAYSGMYDVIVDGDGREHHAKDVTFAWHCGLKLEDVLTSSFYPHHRQPQFMDSDGKQKAMEQEHVDQHRNLPEFFISLNHQQSTVVLTIRGTLTLNDMLTNLGCEYQRIKVGAFAEGYVHGGMWKRAIALADPCGRMHKALNDALVKNADYNIVLVGHSLGAGVASLIALKWSNLAGTDMSIGMQFETSADSQLPPHRRLHAYAYGPPCVMSIELSRACRGLVTSIIHGQDFTSGASLGSLLELRDLLVCGAVALQRNDAACPNDETAEADADMTPQPRRKSSTAFQSTSDANGQSTSEHTKASPTSASYFESCMNTIRDHMPAYYTGGTPSKSQLDEDEAPAAEALSTVFARVKSKLNHMKLYAPGDIHRIWYEDNDAAASDDQQSNATKTAPINDDKKTAPNKASKLTMALVECPEQLYSYVHFSQSMFLDHSPGRYEQALHSLRHLTSTGRENDKDAKSFAS